MKTVKHTTNSVYHIVDTETKQSNCNRDASDWFTGISTGQYVIDWTSTKRCSRCGTIEDYQAISDAAHQEWLEFDARRKEVKERVSRLSTDKDRVFTENLLPRIMGAMEILGITSNNKGHSLECVVQAEGHVYCFEIKYPHRSYGYDTGTLEIVESKPHWHKTQ